MKRLLWFLFVPWGFCLVLADSVLSLVILSILVVLSFIRVFPLRRTLLVSVVLSFFRFFFFLRGIVLSFMVLSCSWCFGPFLRGPVLSVMTLSFFRVFSFLMELLFFSL